MDRLELTPEAIAFVAEKRDAHHNAAATEDLDLDARDRRDRADVLGPLCRVKRDDTVLFNGFPVHVIGPARGEGYFYALLEAPWGFMDVPLDGSLVTDRAPADPLEEPLPIFEEPPTVDDDPSAEPAP